LVLPGDFFLSEDMSFDFTTFEPPANDRSPICEPFAYYCVLVRSPNHYTPILEVLRIPSTIRKIHQFENGFPFFS
jgi:hypothetical protein